MKKKRIRFILLVLLSVVLCMALPQASAETPAPREYKTIPYMEKSDTVYEMQKVLLKLGYFDEVDESFEFGVLDEATVAALQLFCDDNHQKQLPLSEGISPDLQKFLLEGSPDARKTPAPTPAPVTATPYVSPTPFPSITIGAFNNAVDDVQSALSRKGYFEGIDGRVSLGTYDDITEEAVKRFCEVDNIQYEPEKGLTEFLYKHIMSTNAPTQRPKAAATPVSFIYIYTGTDEPSPEVRDVQQRLKDLDYFRELGDPKWGVYEEVTQGAVDLFCNENGLSVNPNGMDSVFLERLKSDEAKRNPLPFAPIRRGDSNDTVDAVQRRLNALGYYKNRKQTGACDDDMITALTLFAQANNVAFENETVTKDLHDRIMDENAVKYTDTVEQKGFFERVKDFLTGNVNFLGIRMPAFLMILLVVIILAGLIFLLIHTFGADGKDGGSKKSGSGPVIDSWDPKDGPGQGTKKLELEISYRGSVQRVTVSLDKPLRIGRSEHTLPINESDTDISRKHCQLYFRGNTLIVRDTSKNGTSVNHRTYHDCESVVYSGDTLSLGNHEIRVRIL